MADHLVLVIGRPTQARPLVQVLRERGLLSWATEAKRCARDAASLEWADAVVLIDTGNEVDPRNLRLLCKSRGPSLLAASAPLTENEVVDILQMGVDIVEPWPSSPDVLAARVAGLLRVPRALATDEHSERARLSA